MAFNYMENISYNNNKPNFERDSVKTIAQLLAVNPSDKGYDYGHIVFCEEDGRHYKFNYDYDNPPKESEKDCVTGWFVSSDGTRKAKKSGDNSVLSKGYIILNRNRDFVSQINDDETIYEIRDFFDLNSEEITLPANSILKFNGGMLANGTVNGNGIAVEAPLVRIFCDDIILKGEFNCDFYPEWFGAVTYSKDNTDDNSMVFNNAINQIYRITGAHDLILTGTYLIKDTIFLKPKVSLIGKYGKTIYDASVGNSAIGSGFLVDFNDNNKYAIDSYLTQLFHKVDSNGNLVLDEKGKPISTVSGTRQAVINYNQLWFDNSPTDENFSSYTLIGEGSEEITNATKSLHTNGWRKSTNIKNIILQPLNKPTASNEIPFGGIRLNSWFSGTIDSVTIQGFAVGLNMANSWSCYINRLNIKTYYIGVYLGKFCTQCNIRNSDIESMGKEVIFDHKAAALIYRNKENLLLPYDSTGRVEGDEGFTYPITKYIATPESVDNNFLSDYADTQLLTVAIMSESYSTDRTKLLVDNVVFQDIDAILINTNNGNFSFNFCYIEKVWKLGLYSHWGVVKWLNPSFDGNQINPYGAVSIDGEITIEGMHDVRCYPSYTMEDLKGGKFNRALYYITPPKLYYDKFIVTNGVVESGSVAAAKQIIPINDTYYVGTISGLNKYDWNDYPELAAGLKQDSYTSFANIIKRYNPDKAIICNVLYGTDFSATDSNGNVPLLSDKKFTIMKLLDGNSNTVFPLMNPMRLYNSEINIESFELNSKPGSKIDGKTAPTLDSLFEVSGKCKIRNTGYIEKGRITGNLIKLSAGNNNEPVDLDLYLKSGGDMDLKESTTFDLLIANPDNVKYKIRIRTAKSSYITFINTVPPSVGMEVGETWVYTPSGTATATNPDQYTLGKTIFVWNGINWVGVDTNNQYYGINANWEDDNFNVSFYVSGTLCNQILYTK